ncbi:MAG: helix-turn-helix domain-containing protein [Bacteroidales bacterium]|nr:helix-turn-helix domain-containing protein [Bacteroidales bacterium]
MKERIIAFLETINLGSSQFAGEIGVQPSGISHIVSGRNNPSLDFVLKVLNRYPDLSSDWLLFGRGEMFRDSSPQPDGNYGVVNPDEAVRSEISPEYRRGLFAGAESGSGTGNSVIQGAGSNNDKIPEISESPDTQLSSGSFGNRASDNTENRHDDNVQTDGFGIGAHRMILVYGDGTFEQFNLRRGNSKNPVPESDK